MTFSSLSRKLFTPPDQTQTPYSVNVFPSNITFPKGHELCPRISRKEQYLMPQMAHILDERTRRVPCLVWLSGLGTGLQTKDCWFNSGSGLLPRLQARSPAGDVQEATERCFSPTLSLPLKINKISI